MIKNRPISEKESNLIMASMTPDDWATFHLFWSILFQKQMESGFKEMSHPVIVDYMEKATEVIKNAIQNTDVVKLAKDQIMANKVLMDGLPNVFDGHSEENFELWKLNAYFYRSLLLNYAEFRGHKPFNVAFTDLTFNDDGYPTSTKALTLIVKILKEYQKVSNNVIKWDDVFGEIGEEGDDEYDLKEDLLDACKESWYTIRNKLVDIQPETALVFHLINLEIGWRYLSDKQMSKYSKNVLKALSTYKSDANPQQKRFALSNARDTYEKLKDKLIDFIHNQFDEDYDTAIQYGTFSLASDYNLSRTTILVKDDEATGILEEVSVNKDEIQISQAIKDKAADYSDLAETEVDELVQENADDWDYDEIPEGYPMDEDPTK